MNKNDLLQLSSVSVPSFSKIGKCENIAMDVILKICTALDCGTDYIMEVVEDKRA